MNMKLANPLNYPLAVLTGGIVLFCGVRLAQLPSLIILPVAGAIAFGGASFLHSRAGEQINIDNPALEKELQNAKQQADLLIEKAENLRSEAKQLLHDSWQMDLLTAVEISCDRILQLPAQIEQLTKKMSGGDSLLSVTELEKQLNQVKNKQKNSSGIALQQLIQLENSIKRNINLAKQGQDARQAQVFSLNNLITESAGVLQQLQNKLRSSDLNNTQQLNDLQDLSKELNNLQENVNLFMET